MAKSEVTTTADINGEKITVYVDEEEFYKKVKMGLLKKDLKLNEFLKQRFAVYVNESSLNVETSPNDPELKNKVKGILSINGLKMKDLIEREMNNLVN